MMYMAKARGSAGCFFFFPKIFFFLKAGHADSSRLKNSMVMSGFQLSFSQKMTR